MGFIFDMLTGTAQRRAEAFRSATDDVLDAWQGEAHDVARLDQALRRWDDAQLQLRQSRPSLFFDIDEGKAGLETKVSVKLCMILRMVRTGTRDQKSAGLTTLSRLEPENWLVSRTIADGDVEAVDFAVAQRSA